MYMAGNNQQYVIMLGNQAIVQFCCLHTVILESAIRVTCSCGYDLTVNVQIGMVDNDHLVVRMGCDHFVCPLGNSRTHSQLQTHEQVIFTMDIHQVVIVIHSAFFKGTAKVIILRILCIGEIFIPQHEISFVVGIIMVAHHGHEGHNTIQNRGCFGNDVHLLRCAGIDHIANGHDQLNIVSLRIVTDPCKIVAQLGLIGFCVVLHVRQDRNTPICVTNYIVFHPQLSHISGDFIFRLGSDQVHKVCTVFGNKAMEQTFLGAGQRNTTGCAFFIGQSTIPHPDLTDLTVEYIAVIILCADLQNAV